MTDTSAGPKRKVKEEVNSVLDFLIFALSAYFLLTTLFDRSVIDPFSPATVTSGNETVVNGTATVEQVADYGTSSITVLLILMFALSLGRISEWATAPSLLGMLLAGMALSNLPFLSSLVVPSRWSSVMRKAAFVVILLRGGLSLDGEALKRMKGACIRLALCPCTVEAVVVAVAAKLIFGLSILFGLLLGFILAAVSPAVVVPSMIRISQDGYGSTVSSLVVAAASLDDVYAITLFSLCFSILFATGDSIWLTLLRAPLEVVGGCVYGVMAGYALMNVRPWSRVPVLLAFSMATFFGSARMHVDSAGALAVLVTAFVVGGKWRRGETGSNEEASLKILWEFLFQPLLFGLIGFELSFTLLSWRLVLLGLVVLAVGVAARTGVAFLAVMGSGMSPKERLFVALAWIPKATVQAALAPVALEMVRGGGYGQEEEEGARVVFALAVLSILTTAPIGAAVIRMTAPILLKRDTVDTVEDTVGGEGEDTVEESKSVVEMRSGESKEGEEMKELKSGEV